MTKNQNSRSEDKNRLFRDMMRIEILEDEIEYATKQLRPQDTGHINTAIGWLNRRVRQIKGQTND
jgi:hypothetical protein